MIFYTLIGSKILLSSFVPPPELINLHFIQHAVFNEYLCTFGYTFISIYLYMFLITITFIDTVY